MSKKSRKKDPFAAREAEKYERPIPSREFILAHLEQRGAPAKYQDLLVELELNSDEEQEALHRRLKAMIRDGELEQLRKGNVWPAGLRTMLKGRVHIEKGKINRAWVVPDDGSARILLPFKESQAVSHGNYVVVSVLNLELEQLTRTGNLVEILEQGRLVVTGRFVKEPDVSYVIPHGKEFTQDILIPAGHEQGATEGHIVVVEIRREPSRWSELIGHVIEILGHENTAGIEIQAATRAYGLPEEWPENVLKEISDLKEIIPAAAKRGRLNICHLPLITIDGEDARDFDDAVYCEQKPSGGWTLYVAIADVSYYVKTGSALDKEAKERGNSVYFPGKVIPMLPEILSNGLCSLKPEVERLCMVCILKISKTGKIIGYEFHEAIMHSAARLTYNKVAALLKGENGKLVEQYASLMPHIQSLYELYCSLRQAREERGAIEFETSETRVIFGENGKIGRIEPVERNDAHRMIEECMLCANVATARFLNKHKLPGLYRIHESPPPDKLADLKAFLGELGLALGGEKQPTPLDYAQLLRSVQNRSDANVIQLVLLRSLSQAVYSPDNVGHFGLAYPAYCHFTSPIRRYPDLITHRQIRTVLRGQWAEKDHANKEQVELKNKDTLEYLTNLGVHTSMTERRADEATRDVLRWLKCEYIQKHIGDVFDGVISGVTRFGFFVELKNIYIDGLVHVTSLKGDYYFFDNTHHRLVGERSGVIFKLGDSVKVKVTKVDIDQRRIDFDLISPLTVSKKSKNVQKPEKLDKSKQSQRSKRTKEPGRSQKSKKSQKSERTQESNQSKQSRSKTKVIKAKETVSTTTLARAPTAASKARKERRKLKQKEKKKEKQKQTQNEKQKQNPNQKLKQDKSKQDQSKKNA